MKTISYQQIVSSVNDIVLKAAYDLPKDVLTRLQELRKKENSVTGTGILDQILDNATIAARQQLPICQDTGTAVVFVDIGNSVTISGGLLTDAIHEGVRKGYHEGYLRKSIVKDPLFDRTNTNDNTPASIHVNIVEGDTLTMTILPKGGGCENMSYLAMLKPADGKQGIIDFVVSSIVKSGGNPCPPVVTGIGIGGTADKACFLAKKALLRPIGSQHHNPQYAAFESELFDAINKSGVGPQGLGGYATTLAVHIETSPCHIASMPVALNLNCHAARKAILTL